MIYCAWRYGSEDPWRLFNSLDADYRRLWDPSLPPMRPRHPDRLQNFMLACGKVAAIADGKMDNKRSPVIPRRRPPGVVLPAWVRDPRKGV